MTFPFRWIRFSTRPRASAVLLIAALVTGVHLTGCAAGRSGPYAPVAESRRDTALAERLTRRAAELIATDPPMAEALLRDALAADLYHGPAHNNLGALYLSMNPPRLYEAAGEFEWARKLMPGHPDPRLNLALTLELAGRTEDAVAGYHAALGVDPDHLPTMQALARLQVRAGKQDESTPRLLREIALRTASAQWRDWALTQSARQSAPSPP